MPDAGQDNAITSSRTAVTVENCDDEPIRVPGSIQPHAALVVLEGEDVIHVSANLEKVLGIEGPVLTVQDLPQDLADAIETAALSDAGRISSTLVGEGSTCLDVAIAEDGDRRLVRIEPDPEASWNEPGADAMFEALGSIQAATTTAEVVDGVVDFVKRLTGFDRVMAYEFAPDHHGVVIAEKYEPHLDDSFLGMHYPASDIPAQARQLYREQWIRLIPDVDYEAVPITPDCHPGTAEPLDLSAVDARSVSPIHCEYLRNMGVAASMSISLLVEGELWGLVACHHYAGPLRPAVATRRACEFVALAASVMLGAMRRSERAEDAAEIELSLNRLAEQLLSSEGLMEGLMADEDRLLGLVEADGAAVLLGASLQTIGDVPDDEIIRAVADHCATASGAAVYSTTALAAAMDIDLARLGSTSGVASLPISSTQRNYVLWFRNEWSHDVRWAGEPAKSVTVDEDGRGRLRPRASFDEWVESVRGESRPWSTLRLDAIEALRGLIGRHVSRTAEQLARLNSELARSNSELDAFAYVAAHDLREPLRGIVNYATFLAEDYSDVLDEDGRQQVAHMLLLADRMGALLRSLLNYARVGRSEIRRQPVMLSALVDDVRSLVGARLVDSGGELELVNDIEVVVDVDSFTQVLMNLVANALKYSDAAPVVKIGSQPASVTPQASGRIERSLLSDVDQEVIFVEDNGIGIDEEHLDDIFRVFRRLHAPEAYGGGEGAGLTISRRIVERHGGTIWATSIKGKGTTFYMTIGDVQ